MPRDVSGRMVRIGWAEHQILWIRAAATLPFGERELAYQDISGMTGWDVKSIRCKAASLKAQDRENSRAFLQAHLTKNWLSENTSASPKRVLIVPRPKEKTTPSGLTGPADRVA